MPIVWALAQPVSPKEAMKNKIRNLLERHRDLIADKRASFKAGINGIDKDWAEQSEDQAGEDGGERNDNFRDAARGADDHVDLALNEQDGAADECGDDQDVAEETDAAF